MTDGIWDTFAAGYDGSEVTQVVHFSEKKRLLSHMELLADISMEDADAAPSEISICALSSPPSQAISSASPFEVAKNRIRRALKEFSENSKLIERSPCLLLDGCHLDEISDSEMKTIHQLLLHLCSTIDKRRWSAKSGYVSKGIRAYRGACSRSGTQRHTLIHQNGRSSAKCQCKATFTLFSNGEMYFKHDHSERCLPDSYMGNDGYVFNFGLSPVKRSLIVSNLSDMLSDFGTTPAAATRQIEHALVKSGDTGFGSGKVAYFICLQFYISMTLRNCWYSIGQLCAPQKSFTKNMILSAKKVSGFTSTNSSESLEEFLREIVDQSLPHRILYDNENVTIKAISFHDPDWLPKNVTANQLQFNVAVSDVTFGLTCPKSGINK